MECSSTARHRNCVLSTHLRGELFFERRHSWALRDPARFDRLRNRRYLFTAEPRLYHVDAAHVASTFSARHQATSRRKPSSRLTFASKPRSRAAADLSASRRVTPLTGRSGPNSISKSESIAFSRAWARSSRLVSTPLATL